MGLKPIYPLVMARLWQVLHGRVIGQNEAVTAVAKAVRRARAGLKPDSTAGEKQHLVMTNIAMENHHVQ